MRLKFEAGAVHEKPRGTTEFDVKTLLILRHAKSSWKDPGLADHERPLNKRGRRDAPRMGERMREEGLCPDLLISSTATRARQTADRLAATCGYEGTIALDPELYHGSAGAYLQAAHGAPLDADTVLLVGHNPSIEEAVWMLTGRHERMPTAALARIEFDVDGWGELRATEGRLQSVWRPKEIF